MSELIGGAYPIKLPSLTDVANIQYALTFLHYGDDTPWTTPADPGTNANVATESVAGHLYTINQNLAALESNVNAELGNITSVGNVTTGTWSANVITPTYGGTGVNNGSYTITLGSNFKVNSTGAAEGDTLKYVSANSAWEVSKFFAIQDISEKTDAYTLVLTDQNDLIKLNKSTAFTVTVPKNASVAFPLKTEIHLLQYGTGKITVAPIDGDVTVHGTPGLSFRDRWSMATLIKIGTDEWILTGDLTT